MREARRHYSSSREAEAAEDATHGPTTAGPLTVLTS
jgi:hypothetical protein